MTSIRHNPEPATLPGRRLPRRRPRGDPRRRLEPYDAHRHRPPGRGQPDDALPPLARHPDPARRPDDPRVGRRRRRPPAPATASDGDAARPDRTRRSSRPSQALRANALLRRIVDVDPEVLLPYLLDRRGRSQEMVADALAALIAEGQQDGTIRRGDPVVLARCARAGRPRLHALRAHHVRRRRRRDADVAHLDAELDAARREVPRAMTEQQRSTSASPTSPSPPTSWSSASASPAPESRSTPPAAGSSWSRSTPTTSPSAPAAGAPSWCTAACATWPRARSTSPTRAPSSAAS